MVSSRESGNPDRLYEADREAERGTIETLRSTIKRCWEILTKEAQNYGDKEDLEWVRGVKERSEAELKELLRRQRGAPTTH